MRVDTTSWKFLKYLMVSILTLISPAIMFAQGINWLNGGYVQNVGQWDKQARYMARYDGMVVWVTDKGLIYDKSGTPFTTGKKIYKPKKNQLIANSWVDEMITPHHVVSLEFNNANTPRLTPNVVRSEVVNFFIGNDKAKHATNLPLNGQVVIDNLYDGVSAVLLTDGGLPRYDFHVAPNANPNQISFSINGAERITQTNDGGVLIKTSCGGIQHGSIYAYQKDGYGNQQKVACAMKVNNNTVSFSLGHYDKSKALIIDPIVYSTFTGGEGSNGFNSITKAGSSDDYIAVGYTTAVDFPKTTGSYTSANSGNEDAVVVRFDNKLQRYVFATFIGGTGTDICHDVSFERGGTNNTFFLAGETSSTNFPITSGVFSQIYRGGNSDAFILRMNATGDFIRYSTFVGGAGDDRAYGIATDGNYNAYVVGETTSNNLATTTNAFRRVQPGGGLDGFIISLQSSGAGATYFSYIGGTGQDRVNDVTTPNVNDNRAYLTGETRSTDLTLQNTTPAQIRLNNTPNGTNSDAFVYQFNDAGNTLVIGTFVGGSGDEAGFAIDVNNVGLPIIAGVTKSTNLAVTTSAVQLSNAGGSDILMCEVSANGRQFNYLTYFGGTSDDEAVDIQTNGSVFVVGGRTTSSNFPVTADAGNPNYGTNQDGFVAKFGYSKHIYSSFVGGSKKDVVNGVSLISEALMYICGETESSDFPTTDSAVQKNFKGTAQNATQGFVARYAFTSLELTAPVGTESICPGQNLTISWQSQTVALGVTSVRLEYSSDNGTTWSIITPSTSNRTFVWNTPNTLIGSSRCKVRATDIVTAISSTNPVSFTVKSAPKVSSITKDTTLCSGLPLTLSASATGEQLKYQWRLGGQNINGATSDTYAISSLSSEQSGQYDVVVTGGCNPPATSPKMTLNVLPPPTITEEPKAIAVPSPGNPATFEVKVTGSGLRYRWQKNKSDIGGAPNSAQYIIPNVQSFDIGTYRVIVSGDCGADTSAEARLDISSSVPFEQSSDGRLTIISTYPQPVNDVATVEYFSYANSPVRFKLVDLMGRVITEFTSDGTGKTQIGLSGVQQGSYVLLAESSGNSVYTRITVLR
jgi:hypothetical protein